MKGGNPHIHRFQITVELGPSYDYSRLALLKWLVQWVIALHREAPVPITLRVEPITDDPP